MELRADNMEVLGTGEENGDPVRSSGEYGGHRLIEMRIRVSPT